MVMKKRSETASRKHAAPSPEDIDALVDRLADRPYGKEVPQLPPPAPQVPPAPKAKPISISLPPAVIQDLEDQVRANKLSGEGPKTVSGLIKLALKHYGYKL